MTEGIAIYGGTFNPVHIGHLRSAIEVRAFLDIPRVLMVPSNTPPHRDEPLVPATARLEMLQLAVQGLTGIEVDDREINRSGVSYSIDTLEEFRSESSSKAIYFIMGADAFALLHTWHRWQELTNFAHLIVLQRPDTASPQLADPVVEWLTNKEITAASQFGAQKAGSILRVTLAQWPVSATDIRGRCQTGQSIDFLVPESVQRYIVEHRLYL